MGSETLAHPLQWILGSFLVFSSLGVILARKPVHSSLAFLLTLLILATIYLELSAQFIAAMQVLVYAGAILVLFIFVMVLFQDAHDQIEEVKPKSLSWFLYLAGGAFLLTLIFLGRQFVGLNPSAEHLPPGFGTVQGLGKALYVDFFFPFEAVILIFLVAVLGALYIAKKVK